MRSSLLDMMDSAGLFDVILAIHGESPGLKWAGTETGPDSKSVSIETSHVSRVQDFLFPSTECESSR